MIKEQISLIVVDDHPRARNNISNLLKKAKDIVIVGEAANGAQAIDLALSEKPDIMLLDIDLPDSRGTSVMRRLNTISPDLKVLAVSSYNDRQFIMGMKENGASGYITKDEIPVMLVNAIRSIVYEGRDWVGPRFQKQDLTTKFGQTLTKKETEILKQLSIDRSWTLIATDLGMREEQLNEYLALLMKKYKAESLSELNEIARKIFSDLENQ